MWLSVNTIIPGPGAQVPKGDWTYIHLCQVPVCTCPVSQALLLILMCLWPHNAGLSHHARHRRLYCLHASEQMHPPLMI
jgi:hypothetical protein